MAGRRSRLICKDERLSGRRSLFDGKRERLVARGESLAGETAATLSEREVLARKIKYAEEHRAIPRFSRPPRRADRARRAEGVPPELAIRGCIPGDDRGIGSELEAHGGLRLRRECARRYDGGDFSGFRVDGQGAAGIALPRRAHHLRWRRELRKDRKFEISLSEILRGPATNRCNISRFGANVPRKHADYAVVIEPQPAVQQRPAGSAGQTCAGSNARAAERDTAARKGGQIVRMHESRVTVQISVNVMSIQLPSPAIHVVHPLAYANAFQDTAAFRGLVRWWENTRRGLCVLVGMGGAGKTAAADQFLRRIGVLGGDRARSTARPQATLVFSLAEANADAFFFELAIWLNGDNTTAEITSYDQVRRRLTAVTNAHGPILLVLDGLEAVQSTRTDDGIGRIVDYRLRDLLFRVAYGAIPGISVVATTRFALPDIEAQRFPHILRVDVERLDRAAAIGLLRARGVSGTNRDLARVAESFGDHALTIDLAATYVGHTGVTPRSVADLGNDGATVTALVHAYRDIIGSDAGRAAADALLASLAMFRGTVSADLLAPVVSLIRSDLSWEAAVTAPALAALLELRLIRQSGTDAEPSYALHEVVRDVIYAEIDPVVRPYLHESVALLLQERAEELLNGRATMPRLFDLLEEVVYHQLRSHHPLAALYTYWQSPDRLGFGNFTVLGHQYSDYTRGERVCRMLNLEAPPERIAPYLRDEGNGADAALISDWGLHLLSLGELGYAESAHRTAHLRTVFGENHANRPVSARNLADITLLRGIPVEALRLAEDGKRYAEELVERYEGFVTRQVIDGFDLNFDLIARARLIIGDLDGASNTIDGAVALHHLTGDLEFTNVSLADGRPYIRVLLARGDASGALALSRECTEAYEHASDTSCELRELTALSLLDLERPDEAIREAKAIETWASAHDSAPKLCIANALYARIALRHGTGEAAHAHVLEALRIARESGLGLLHIDLLVLQAEAALLLNDPDEALHAAATALFGQEPLGRGETLYLASARIETPEDDETMRERAGIFPPRETGRPYLLAATHPLCSYAWGKAEARRMYAEALLARLAKDLNITACNVEGLDRDSRATINAARRQLMQALGIVERSLPSGTDHPNIVRFRNRIEELDGGVLTGYDVLRTPSTFQDGASLHPRQRRLLISYNHRDADFALRLADDLEKRFPDVFIDRRRIHVGQSFVAAINQALLYVTDFILVFSSSAATSSWVQNELDAAIALRNEGMPLHIRPVVIDGTAVPPLIANLSAVRVDQLGYEQGLERLLASLDSD
jgi:TIR domain